VMQSSALCRGQAVKIGIVWFHVDCSGPTDEVQCKPPGLPGKQEHLFGRRIRENGSAWGQVFGSPVIASVTLDRPPGPSKPGGGTFTW
jgi:hypothetical protein